MPTRVHGTSICVDSPVDCQKRQHDNAFLVDDVELVADGGYGETGAGGEDGGLGSEAVAGEGLEDGVGGRFEVLLLGNIALGAAGGGGGEGDQGRECGSWDSGPDWGASSACRITSPG